MGDSRSSNTPLEIDGPPRPVFTANQSSFLVKQEEEKRQQQGEALDRLLQLERKLRVNGIELDCETNLCEACQRMFLETTCTYDLRLEPNQPATSDETYAIINTKVLSGAHYTYPDACKAAAEKGCSICYVVFERFCILFDRITTFTGDSKARTLGGQFTEYQIREWHRKRQPKPSLDVPKDTWVLEITFDSIRRANNLPTRFDASECMVEFLLLPVNSHAELFTSYALSPEIGSPGCWDRIKTWLTACLNHHSRCAEPPLEHAFVPSRLLQIGLDQDSNARVHLCEHAELGCRYLALSHRWGSNMPVLVDKALPNDHTTGISLDELRVGVPVSRLIPTFQDAVSSALQLEIRYLWIDSLCIIQNSVEDWSRESAQMHDVYSHAFCTVAATSSVDGSGRLFHDRNADTVRLSQITSSWTVDKERVGILPLDFWRVNVHEAALNRRGWVLQERMLSRRVIHFGRHQVLWECNECDLCETFPERLPDLVQTVATRFKGLDINRDGKALMQRVFAELEPQSTWKVPVEGPESASGKRSMEASPAVMKIVEIHDKLGLTGLEGYYLWARILEKYNNCKLTYGKDKLVAISGLAQRMERLLDDMCFSGLWKKTMPSQLLWRIEDYETKLTFYGGQGMKESDAAEQKPWQVYALEAKEYRAPSWSWASLDGIVAASVPSADQGLINFIGARGQPQQVQQGGLPLATHLILEGALHFGTMEFEPLSRQWKTFVSKHGIRCKRPSGPAAAASATLVPDVLSAADPGQQTPGVAYPDHDMSVGETHSIILLPVCQRNRRKALSADRFSTTSSHVSGLLLDPEPGARGTYRRIGVLDLFHNDLVLDWFSCHPQYDNMFDQDGNMVLI